MDVRRCALTHLQLHEAAGVHGAVWAVNAALEGVPALGHLER